MVLRNLEFPAFYVGAFKYGPFYISTYALTLLLAMSAVFYLAFRFAPEKKVRKRDLWFFFGITTICIFAGARLFYLILWPRETLWQSFLFYFSFGRSGLASFGAVFGIVAGIFIYRQVFRPKDLWRILDVASIGLALGLAIGRLGCFLNGCCYGSATSMPWGVWYKEAIRHPTQVYDMLNGLSVFGFVQYMRKKKLFDGALFLMTLGLYSFVRCIVEFFRATPHLGWFTPNQYLYFVSFALCAYIFYRRSKLS